MHSELVQKVTSKIVCSYYIPEYTKRFLEHSDALEKTSKRLGQLQDPQWNLNIINQYRSYGMLCIQGNMEHSINMGLVLVCRGTSADIPSNQFSLIPDFLSHLSQPLNKVLKPDLASFGINIASVWRGAGVQPTTSDIRLMIEQVVVMRCLVWNSCPKSIKKIKNIKKIPRVLSVNSGEIPLLVTN